MTKKKISCCRYALLYIWVLSFTLIFPVSSQAIEITPDKNQVFIGQTAYMMRDQINGYQHTEIVDVIKRQPVIGSDYVNTGLQPGVSWISFEFSTTKPSDFIFELKRAKAARVSVFFFESDMPDKALVLQPFDIKHHSPIYQLSTSIDTQYTLLIRMENSSTTFKPVLWSYVEYQQHAHIEFLTMGLFFGVLICLALYNLIIFFAVRRQAYIWYAGYIFALVVWRSALYGLWSYLGIPLYTQAAYLLVPFVLLDILFALLFCIHFLETARHAFYLDKIIHIVCWMLGIATLISTTLPIHVTISFVVFGLALGGLICIVAGGYCLYKGVRIARFYVASWIPLVFGSVIVQLAVWEVIPSTHFTQTFIEVTILLEALLMSLALADKLRQTEREKVHLATHDPLTRLPNRNLVQLGLESFKSRVGFTLVQLKLTNLDEIRLKLGLKVANAVLCRCVEQLNEWARLQRRAVTFEMLDLEPQKLGQLDHGVMVMAFRGTHVPLSELATQVQDIIKQPIEYHSALVHIQCHMGASIYPHHSQDIMQLLENTSFAVVDAQRKELAILVYAEDRANEVQFKLELLEDLKQALISGNELSLCLQPKLHLASKKVVGAEVLLRWIHPKYGVIEPLDFIPLAKDAGIISDLSFWVVSEALQTNKLIQQICAQHQICINVCTTDLISDNFVKHVEKSLLEYGLSGSSLLLEISEAELFEQIGLLHLNVEKLRSHGVGLSIDDFASARSALAELSRVPIKEVKIDACYIQQAGLDDLNQSVITLIRAMANALNAEIVAEGVEDGITHQYLQEQNIPLAQGFFLAKPMPIGEYLDWLKAYNQMQDSLLLGASGG
ncbi:EAL domain-containing protein [Catenovulum agarivorans]|uniref:EAL domain-containing protein n=1 Tax=Catenovulum agarivorans TaxID=1172192 RepID=UPI00035EB13A|nr:EAL domain-containing protein [Catenovulum agarivorans]